MTVELSSHAELRLKTRRISQEEVQRVIEYPEAVFLDVTTGSLVAVGKRLSKPTHWLLVVFRRTAERVRVVTIIETSKAREIIHAREVRGRWLKVK